jgi:tetratricopeptide (TPR) repeat protein
VLKPGAEDKASRVSLERIEITPFAVIAGDVLQQRRNGSLTVVKPPQTRVLYWSQGELVMAASTAPEDSLGHFLVRRGVMTADRAREMFGGDPNAAVATLHEAGLLDLSTRQTLMREWLASQFIPLFSLDEGTAAFDDDEPLPPEQRVFVQSTAALFIEGIRTITNGLVLRRSLGDLKRTVEIDRDSNFRIDALPLTDAERRIASALTQPLTIETFLKHVPGESTTVSKVVIAMLALGVYTVVQQRAPTPADYDDMQRDLMLLAAIGAEDQRSLRAVALSKQLPNLDHYQVLDIPRAATRAQVISVGDVMRKRFDASTFPPAARDSINVILRRIDEAVEVLKDPMRRGAYDKLLHTRGRGSEATIQQRLTQQMIAEQNFMKAKELATAGDYYGAIVLLKQTVNFVPDHADAWVLLGSCQERNPRWRRDAAESFQMALSANPNNTDALISLGDLYRAEGLITRAQTCYEDVLKIAPENEQARSRLAAIKKK